MNDPKWYAQRVPLIRLLDAQGDGSTDWNIVGDYSTNPVTFRATVPEGKVWYIDFMKIQITDLGLFSRGRYGNLPELINGYIPKVVRNGIVTQLTPDPITINDHFIHYSFEYQLTPFAQNTYTSSAVLRFDTPFNLHPGDKIKVKMQDNFTALIDHTIAIHGIEVTI